MKKITFTLITFILFACSAFSQSQYLFIEFKDVQKPAVVNEYPYSDKTVTNALEEKLNKMGYKGKETKGYTIYKAVSSGEIGSQPYDLYFGIERKSKKEKENTIVRMLISKGNEVFISDTDEPATINNAKTFLNNLSANIQAYDLEQQIKAQEDIVKKAERKYKNLLNDADDLQKKKRNLEKDIEDNQKDQKIQQAEVEKQLQFTETLRAKRTSVK